MKLLRILPRFQRARRALDSLKEREAWSRADITAFQLERINRLWRSAIKTTAHYRRLFADSSLPNQFASLEEFQQLVPTLSKAQVRNDREDFLSAAALPGSLHRTGGSTGTPTAIYWSTVAHRENLLTRYRCQQMWDVDFLDRQAMLWGHSASFEPSWKGRLARWTQPAIDWTRGRLRLSAYELGAGELKRYLEQIQSFQPAMLYGYSAAVLLLARRAVELGTRCPTLKLAILTGEPAFGWLKSEVEKGLDTPVSVEYGSVECGIIANEWSDRKLRVREDTILLETLPRDDGNYDVVVTSLINESFPLLRYRVGDVVPQPLEKDDRGFAVLPSIMGRQNDMLRSRSGALVHSLSVKHAIEHFDNVRRFRAHQDASGKLTLLVESSNGRSCVNHKHIVSRLEFLLDGYPVEISEVEKIPQTRAGKHRWIMSDLVAVD